MTFSETVSHFDIHVYFFENFEKSVNEAIELQTALKKEFPEIRAFPPVLRPIGPHPTGMWEAHITTPEQFGKVVPWLAFHVGTLSILVHPNSYDNNGVADHTDRAIWIGERMKLYSAMLRGPSSKGHVSEAD